MKPFKKKGFFSLEAYYRRSVNIITRISSIYEEGILLTRPENIGSSNSYGLEASVDYSFTKWWKLNTGANVYYYDLSGALIDVNYSTTSLNYSGRVYITFTYKGCILQLSTRYRSGSVTSQGETSAVFTQDASIKKSLYDRRLTFNLSGRNILMTGARESFSNIQNVYVYSIRQPLAPQVSLSVSFKLNNYQKVYDRNEGMDEF